MRNRGFRRDQSQKRKNIIRKRMEKRLLGTKFEVTDANVGRQTAVHDVDCSGPCCGNPRRHFKDISVAEKRIEESEGDQLLDITNIEIEVDDATS